MKTLKNFFRTLLVLTATFTMLTLLFSCSNDDNNNAVPLTTTVYTGEFTVAGTNYTALNIVSDGTYTMTNATDSDSGTWEIATNVSANIRAAISAGNYTFKSKKHDGGTFKVAISGNSISLSNGTLTASGDGVDIIGHTYRITEGYWNGSSMPSDTTETIYLNTDKTFSLVGTGYGFSAAGTYEIDITNKRITFTFTSGDAVGTMSGIYTGTGEYIDISSTIGGMSVYGRSATISGKGMRL